MYILDIFNVHIYIGTYRAAICLCYAFRDYMRVFFIWEMYIYIYVVGFRFVLYNLRYPVGSHDVMCFLSCWRLSCGVGLLYKGLWDRSVYIYRAAGSVFSRLLIGISLFFSNAAGSVFSIISCGFRAAGSLSSRGLWDLGCGFCPFYIYLERAAGSVLRDAGCGICLLYRGLRLLGCWIWQYPYKVCGTGNEEFAVLMFPQLCGAIGLIKTLNWFYIGIAVIISRVSSPNP